MSNGRYDVFAFFASLSSWRNEFTIHSNSVLLFIKKNYVANQVQSAIVINAMCESLQLVEATP